MEVSSFTNLMLFNDGFNEFGYIIIHIAANYLHISRWTQACICKSYLVKTILYFRQWNEFAYDATEANCENKPEIHLSECELLNFFNKHAACLEYNLMTNKNGTRFVPSHYQRVLDIKIESSG